jgi:sterol desaturase/sphingolipid hydroxylase (fatty acid hydroxylase superfamily)
MRAPRRFVIALATYLAFPYDLVAAKVFAPGWVLHRVAINVTLTMAYVGWWYVSIYWWRWAERKYNPAGRLTATRVFHNAWYTMLGALQWSLWEAIFMHLYATDKLPFVRDADAFSSPGNVARMVLWTLVVPVWREFHFYWAHRFLHCRVLYKYVHSLHHRNIDPEPWSGLAMHPIEHLYYLATVAPSLYFCMSPFHLLWNGLHAVISPAAGHSGYEDHWQSDQLHYLHHSKVRGKLPHCLSHAVAPRAH